MSENNNNDLNEVFEEEMDDADVITVPIDETLSNSGEAADAAAVGAALALKADKDELPATIKVNGQQADNQGLILINGTHIPVNGSTQKTLAEAVSEVSGMTAETIPMSEETGAATIAAEIEDIKEDVSDLQEAIDGMEEKTADNIPMETGSTTTVKNAIETLDRKAVKSVNRKLPDAAGDVDLSVVPLAENLQSDKLQSIEGEFIIRTTGGNGAVADGKAYPQHIYGNCQHNGYVAEVLNLTVIPITRTEPDEPITATIDRDTFVAAVDESSTINLYYTTEWSEDPEDYGVTVTGEPVAGDQITIVYVKEQRGTILVADPDRLVGTGWNLFNANDGYARVVKYSDVYGYKIGGTYTSIAFSATLTGDRTSLLPNANGLFNVPSDGYVFVTGGNATDTYILATWSDWTNGPSTGYWEAYRESGIDLSAVVETYFPYGMLKIGTVRDEIDLVAKRSISRIERMVYSEENRAAAAATGRAYDFDESNIYIVRAEYVQNAITISTEYSVSEHGLEWFTETELPLDTEILYGKNLRDKLERDVLTISPQNLVAEEQAQVRRNIGVMDPPLNGNGTAAQLLKTNGDGTTEWTTQGTPTDAQVGTAVSAWLTAHPEATTTVQDGAISRAKLNDDLKEKTDAVPDLKSALSSYENLLCSVDSDYTYTVSFPVVGYYPYWGNGLLNENADYSATQFISIRGLKSFAFTGVAGDVNSFCFYDKDFGFISGAFNKTAWDVPANAYYMRIGIATTDVSTFRLIHMESFMSDIKEDSIKADIALKYLESNMPFYYDSGKYGQAGSPYSPSNIIKAGTKVLSIDVYCTDATNAFKIGFWRTSNNAYYGEKVFSVNTGLNHLFLNVDVEYDSRIVFNVSGKVRYVSQSTGYAITEVSISSNTVTAVTTLNNYGLYATIQYLYKNETILQNVLHVGVGQEYTTINEALTKAYSIESINNPITIIVHPGVYNEVLFIGGTHYVSIIGMNRDDCIVKDGSADYNKAPIRIAGQAYVANMTFIETAEDYVSAYGSGTGKSAWKTDVLAGKAKYDWLGTMMAYAVHCDDTTNGENTICRFENCKMYSECGPAFGGGMQINEYIQLVNCELITNFDEDVYNYSITTTGKTGIAQGTFLCHGKNNGTNMKLLVKDCTIETNIGRVLEMYLVGSDNDALIKFIDTMFYSNKLGSASSYYHWNFSSDQISGLSHGNNIGFLNKPNLAE